MIDPIVKTIEVGCTSAKAFDIFVKNTSSWWPLDRHTVSAGDGKTARSVVIEPNVDGSIYEIKSDGARCEWGRILECEPAKKLAMTWHPGQSSDKVTRVEVKFEDLPGGRSKVTLTHSDWDVLGDMAQAQRDGYASGWVAVFDDRFANACQ